MSERTTIEINGIKMEVDLRHATRIDDLKVGDRVKILVKEYTDYKVHAGIVIGFEPFQKLPTVIVAYVEKSWKAADLKFLYFNNDTRETEMVKAIDDDQLDFDKNEVLRLLDREIEQHRAQIAEIENRKAYFLNNFKAYWERVDAEDV